MVFNRAPLSVVLFIALLGAVVHSLLTLGRTGPAEGPTTLERIYQEAAEHEAFMTDLNERQEASRLERVREQQAQLVERGGVVLRNARLTCFQLPAGAWPGVEPTLLLTVEFDAEGEVSRLSLPTGDVSLSSMRITAEFHRVALGQGELGFSVKSSDQTQEFEATLRQAGPGAASGTVTLTRRKHQFGDPSSEEVPVTCTIEDLPGPSSAD